MEYVGKVLKRGQ